MTSNDKMNVALDGMTRKLVEVLDLKQDDAEKCCAEMLDSLMRIAVKYKMNALISK